MPKKQSAPKNENVGEAKEAPKKKVEKAEYDPSTEMPSYDFSQDK